MKLTTNDSKNAVMSKKTSAVIEFVKKTTKNNRKKTIAVVAVLLLISSYIGFRLNQQPKTPVGQTTAKATVTRGPIEVTVTGTGTLSALAREDIAPKAAGTVKKIYVKNGDSVKKGDLLIELVSSSLSLQVEKARLDVEKAKLNITDSSALSADTILAPFYGKIISLDVKTGEEVAKNAVLVTLQDDSQLVFNMPVSSAIANKAVINQKVDVFLPDKGDIVEGKVLAKDSQPISGYNNESRTNLKIGVATKGNLTSGMKAFGSIIIDGREVDALSVSTMEWLGQTQIKATMTGKLDGVYVQEGQVVKKDQRLFTLSNDSALSQQKTEQLTYQQAQLNLTDLESQLKDLTVKASIDGIISEMDIAEGDEVSASSGTKSSQSQTSIASTSSTSSTDTALGKVINTKQMIISFPVDEVDIAKVKIGQKTDVTVDALPDKVFQGKVTEIAEEGVVTNNVSSFEVTILLDNPESVLKSGMTANVTIIAAQKNNALLIPIEALQQGMGQRKFVFIPPSGDSQETSVGSKQTSTDSQQRRNRRPVTVGLTNESFAEITDGLQEGDKVLLPGQVNATSNSMMPSFGGGRNPLGGGSRNSSGGGNVRFSGSGGSRTGQ